MIEGVPNEGILLHVCMSSTHFSHAHFITAQTTCIIHCTPTTCTQLEHMYTASVWRERYLQQQTHNQQLGAQLREIERKKDELHSHHRELGMLQ